MKKMLFTALVAACAMTACGTKTTETAAEEEVAREVGSSDIAYVQVEASGISRFSINRWQQIPDGCR